jgi:ATP-dependent DNA ligase
VTAIFPSAKERDRSTITARGSGKRDLLHLDGEDLARLPLLERKARLEALFANAPPVLRFSGHVIGNGARVAKEGAKLGVEGMVSRQVDKPYSPGNRAVWVKTKFLNRQEFVIVGWTDPEGSRSSLGSLLLGYYTVDGKLIYAGRAGTGMTVSELTTLLKDYAGWRRTRCPSTCRPASARRSCFRACTGCGPSWSPKSPI